MEKVRGALNKVLRMFGLRSGKERDVDDDQCNLSDEDWSDVRIALENKSKQLELLNKTLRKRLDETESEIKEKCEEIQNLRKQLEDKKEQTVDRETLISEIHKITGELVQLLEDKDAKIRETQCILGEKENELEEAIKRLKEKDRNIAEKEEIIQKGYRQLKELKKQLNDKDSTLLDKQSILEETTKRLEEYEKEQRSLDRSTKVYEEERVLQEIEHFQGQLLTMQSQLAEKKQLTDNLQDKNRRLKCTISERDESIKKLKTDVEKLKQQLSENERLIQTLKNEKVVLQKTVEKNNCTLDKVRESEKEFHKRIEDLQNKMQGLSVDNEKKANEIKVLETQLSDVKMTIENSQKDSQLSEAKSEEMANQVRSLSQELHILKTRRCLEVQVILGQSGEMIEEIEKQFVLFIKRKTEELDLRIVRCMKGSEIQQGVPALVLFASLHGGGRDVTSVLKGFRTSRKTAVVIFHLKPKHALQVQPTDRVLTGKEVEALGGVYDIGFTTNEGIYECKQNDANAISIINFLYRAGGM